MNVPRSGFLMVAGRARRLPSFPGNTQERPLGSEVVEGEAGREEEDDDAAGARGAVAVRGERGVEKARAAQRTTHQQKPAQNAKDEHKLVLFTKYFIHNLF